jgi:myo-inositol-1(or 4)-monophosphatase
MIQACKYDPCMTTAPNPDHDADHDGDHDALSARISLMRTLADRAGTVAMKRFQSLSLAVHAKADALVTVARAARRLRGWSDCSGGMLVATGRVDAWFDPVMNPWDSGPFPVILAEAGGVFTDRHGRRDIHGGRAIVASPRLHAQLLRVVQTSVSQSDPNANS